MVPLDMAMALSYRLSIVTTFPSTAVWPQFSMQLKFQPILSPYFRNDQN